MIDTTEFSRLLRELLGEGEVNTKEFACFKPVHLWTLGERFRHFLYGYEPLMKIWRIDWTLGDFSCNTSILKEDLEKMDKEDIVREVVEPRAACLRRYYYKTYLKRPFPTPEFQNYPGLFPAEDDE